MRRACTIVMLSVLLVVVPGTLAQESTEALPKVVQHNEPIYPPLARQTRIQGEVSVKVTTDGESVREAVAQTGHPLLRKAAEDNAKSWKFASHTPSTFNVIFRYKLMESSVEVGFLKSPTIVEILASPPERSIYYADLGLGAWKAQIKSLHGNFGRLFELSYTGADGDWLNARTLNSKGEREESDFGHKEGDFLAFTITLSQPDGQHVQTFFVGKMTRNKIVGTFVDAAGTSGKWTAVRVPDGPNSR
jgi:Gram-negative bacterial TonB protein C-terminal